MNKQNIIDAVHEKIGGTKVAAEEAVETVVWSIIDGLKKGDEVSVAGMGVFSVKDRPARDARKSSHWRNCSSSPIKGSKFRAAGS